MRVNIFGLHIDNPAFPLLLALVSYDGLTTANGNVLGTTLVDANCSTAGLQPSYAGHPIKIKDGPAAGQTRQIAVHNLATGTITVAAPFTGPTGAVVQITAATSFVILSIGAGGGGGPLPPPPPSVGLWMFGVCDPGMAASTNVLILTNLAGFNDDIFNNEFWIQVIHNANAPGTAPEREIRRILGYVGTTGTFAVDPFTVNVEANDLVALFHESIMAIEILGFGTLDTSSATLPADSTRAEGNNYFDGCLLMPTEGACRFQPRRIREYVGAGGIFRLDPNYPFNAPPGLVDYIIIGDQCGYAWPYILATMDVMESPQVNQPNIEVARLSLHNLRPDDAVIPAVEYANTVINIDRYRFGVDAAWVNIVAGAAMTEADGYAFYLYTFPAANWADGDLVRYRIGGCVVTIPPGAVGADFYVPEQMKTTVVGGLAILTKKIDLILDLERAHLFLNETGSSLTANGTEQVVVEVATPMGNFEPRGIKLDCSNMDWGDWITLRWYERLAATGAYVLKDTRQLNGPQVPALRNIELEPNRHGVRVTLQQTAGVFRTFNWEYMYED